MNGWLGKLLRVDLTSGTIRDELLDATVAKDYIGVDCPTFTDFGRMLETTSPDGVIVATMDSTHDEFIIAAMEHVVGPQKNTAAICIGPEDDMEITAETGRHVFRPGAGKVITEWVPGFHIVEIEFDRTRGLPYPGALRWSFRTQ